MSERERWVIYPLLFLALGAALRDKLVDRTTTKSLVCQELLVMEEQPLGREPVLLARLGRTERNPADRGPSGQFVLNGQIEVVDRDPSNQLAHRLVTIGRAPLGEQGAIGGLIAVNGQIAVNGAINATFYAYQGVPIVPAMRGVVPVPSVPAEILRALPEALTPSGPANPPEAAPPSAAADEAAGADAASDASKSANEPPPSEQPANDE